MDFEFLTFHPMGETVKMAKTVAVQGMDLCFVNEFHGFRNRVI